MSELTSDNVQRAINDCLAEDLPEDDPNYLYVDGIVHPYAFNKEKLETHRDEVISWIDQLPSAFIKGQGGGWSFLNLCMREDGVQWTGLHWVQEQFMCMAIGLGLAEMINKALWSVLPGGMPYVQFWTDSEVTT